MSLPVSAAISNLRDVRERLLGFTAEGVVRFTHISRERLKRLESGEAELTVWESEVLSELYGIDADILSDAPVHVPVGEVASVLASSDEFQTVGDLSRARVISAARAARDIVRLRGLLGVVAPDVPAIQVGYADAPWKAGAEAARLARERIGPKKGAILSMRDWLAEFLPGISLLYARFGENGPSAVAFAGHGFGPAIALNLDGNNENPCVRRFSLAHEIYHLLVDWERVEPLASLSGYMAPHQKEREQRANSFAARFLVPVETTKLPRDEIEAADRLAKRYGLHYAAARLYLQNTRNVALPLLAPPELKNTGAEAMWEHYEKPNGLDGFPLNETPPERRTEVAFLAAQAWSRGLIQRDEFARLLGVTPAEEVERVADFVGVDVPREDETAA